MTPQKQYIQKLLNKWEGTGLLQGLPNNEAKICATLMEQIARLQLRSGVGQNPIVIYPIVRRLLNDRIYPEPEWLFLDFEEWQVKVESIPENIEAQVEYCVRYIKAIQEKICNRCSKPLDRESCCTFCGNQQQQCPDR